MKCIHLRKAIWLDPARVLLIGYKPTIDAWNAHAAVIASNRKIGSSQFYDKFGGFLKTLEKENMRRNSWRMEGMWS